MAPVENDNDSGMESQDGGSSMGGSTKEEEETTPIPEKPSQTEKPPQQQQQQQQQPEIEGNYDDEVNGEFIDYKAKIVDITSLFCYMCI